VGGILPVFAGRVWQPAAVALENPLKASIFAVFAGPIGHSSDGFLGFRHCHRDRK